MWASRKLLRCWQAQPHLLRMHLMDQITSESGSQTWTLRRLMTAQGQLVEVVSGHFQGQVHTFWIPGIRGMDLLTRARAHALGSRIKCC